LKESGCLAIHSNGDVDPTPMGKIMSYYYLSHKTIRALTKHAKPIATFEEALQWMCRATEYDELPVRHNEDLINAELSANLPFKAETFGLPMWDPHVKAFLLLQAYFSRIDLPISDYVGDQISVLDQSIRIVQASIDVLTELGYLQSCRMMITLLQCVKSARWPEDGPLALFPGIEPDAEKSRLRSDAAKPRSLVEATTTSPKELDTVLFKQLSLPTPAHTKVLKALSQLPQLRVNIHEPNALGFAVSLSRLNAAANEKYNIFAPRYPKPQTEGFFLLVSDAATGEILALKRVSWPSAEKSRGGNANKPSTRSRIRLPESTKDRNVRVQVVSDSYIGMEWGVEDVEIPAPPRVADDVAKKPGKGEEEW
jgi:antiviral helicase SLH1